MPQSFDPGRKGGSRWAHSSSRSHGDAEIRVGKCGEKSSPTANAPQHVLSALFNELRRGYSIELSAHQSWLFLHRHDGIRVGATVDEWKNSCG